MKRKAVKMDKPGEQIKDIRMVDEGETSGEIESKWKRKKRSQTLKTIPPRGHSEDYSRSCSRER